MSPGLSAWRDFSRNDGTISFRRIQPVHTLYVVMLGLLLLAVFLLAGHALGHGRQAALYFLPAWLAGAAINMWLGVSKAGYSVRDEAPVFLLVFAIPSAFALAAWWKLPQ
jgi:hypothetical protein